jgi:hypothetical protein
MRSACLTLAAEPGSTLPDVLPLLTDAGFRRAFLPVYPLTRLLATLWDEFEQLSPMQRTNLVAPPASRLRAVLSRSPAQELLSSRESTFSRTEILDGGILIARLPKDELGADAARLIGSLLVSGVVGPPNAACWRGSAPTIRSAHCPGPTHSISSARSRTPPAPDRTYRAAHPVRDHHADHPAGIRAQPAPPDRGQPSSTAPHATSAAPGSPAGGANAAPPHRAPRRLRHLDPTHHPPPL